MTEHAQRLALMAGAIAIALLPIGAGALTALSDEDGRARIPSSTPSASPSGSTSTVEPSRSPEPSKEPETPPPPGSESPILEDGRHFVYVTSASRTGDGSARVRF